MPENIDLMVKLFDTLKQSSDKNEATLQKLIEQQRSLIGHIEYLPIKDLQQALKEHNAHSSSEINSCTETVNTTTNNILDKVKNIESKIARMIVVVLVASSVLGLAFLVGRLSLDTGSLEKKIEDRQQAEHKEIIDSVRKLVRQEFQTIEEKINKFHNYEKKEKIEDTHNTEKKFK